VLSKGKIFFSTTQYPDWLWGPPSLLYDGYQELFPQKVKCQGCEADQSRMVEVYLLSPILVCLHGVLLNWLITKTGLHLPYLWWCTSAIRNSVSEAPCHKSVYGYWCKYSCFLGFNFG
jgi:hypothetical protein